MKLFFTRSCRLVILCSLFLGSEASSFAGWLGFRNDTKEQIVVQETILSNNLARPGKPESLNPGDSVRDSQVCSNHQRKFTIFDTKGNVLHSGHFPCPTSNENILYVIKLDSKGKVAVEPIKSKK